MTDEVEYDGETVDLSIDKGRLDEEWLQQPKLRLEWGAALATARLALDEAQSALALVDAQLDRQVRQDPEEYGVTKVTEATVAAAIAEAEEHQEALTACHVARYDVATCQAVVDGIEHRKRALTCLCDLHAQEYFAVPARTRARGVRKRSKGGDR